MRAERMRQQQVLESQRLAQEFPENLPDWTSIFQRANDDLGEANSRLRALLDLTHSPAWTVQNHNPVIVAPYDGRVGSNTSVFRPNEIPDDSNRRNKRRKLDAETQAFSFPGFRYGKYGQLEPGQLQMEMVSCDGGMFSNRAAYSADNILKDDNSVYCTKGNRCNIILRHQGATAFTLSELVIKAPASMNFSHPYATHALHF